MINQIDDAITIANKKCPCEHCKDCIVNDKGEPMGSEGNHGFPSTECVIRAKKIIKESL